MIIKQLQISKRNTGSGFTPTPILVLFRFLKISLPGLATLVQKLISVKNDRETKKPHQDWCRGFTLVETLVAITILMIAVIGPISLIGDSIHRAYFSKDQIIAINLAQEGVEAARQVRDTGMLNSSTFTTTPANGDYILDIAKIQTAPFTSCSGCDQTVYLDGSGLYRQNISGTFTQFSRLINIIQPGSNPNEKKVTSTVTWRTGGETGTVVVNEYIFKTF